MGPEKAGIMTKQGTYPRVACEILAGLGFTNDNVPFHT